MMELTEVRNAIDSIQVVFIAYIYYCYYRLEKKLSIHNDLLIQQAKKEEKLLELTSIAINSNDYVKSINTKMEKLIVDMDIYLVHQNSIYQSLKQ